MEAQQLGGRQLLVQEGPVGDEAEGALRRVRLAGEVVAVDRHAAGGGRSRPAIMRIAVVLPAPFGPRKPWISPGATDRLTPSTALKEP